VIGRVTQAHSLCIIGSKLRSSPPSSAPGLFAAAALLQVQLGALREVASPGSCDLTDIHERRARNSRQDPPVTIAPKPPEGTAGHSNCSRID
jgi:hypothetical protein